MQWSDIQFNPSVRTLRQFAALWILSLGGLAAWQIVARHNTWAGLVLAAIAVAVGAVGLAKPQAMRPIYVGWMVVAFPIGWAVSKIVLGVLFYGVFMPVALFFRLQGRDPLCLRPATDKNTYWTNKPMPMDVRQYFNQS